MAEGSHHDFLGLQQAEDPEELLQSQDLGHERSTECSRDPPEVAVWNQQLEAHEYQQLQLGPFEAGVTCEILKAWYGVPNDPRRQMDATLHCRNQWSTSNGLTLKAYGYNKLFGDPSPLRPKKMVVEYRLTFPKPWDVATTRYASGVSRVGLYSIIAAKALTNVVGMTLAAGGYAVGKVSASVRNTLDPDAKQGVADSDIFQMAFGTWLRCNGIVPSVTYDPIPPVPGTEAFKPEDVKQTPIILCNHTCYLDGMVLASVFHGPKIIAMKGTLNVPVIGLFAQDIGVIEVDRADPKSRAATIKAIEDHVANWKPGRQPLLLFPEGTTSNGQGLLEFRKGAFVPGVPVRPAVLCYTGSWDPANTSYRETDGKIQAIEDTEWAEQFLGHMMHSVQIRVLPPYVPSEEEKADPLVFASNVRKVMGEAHAELRKEVELKGRPTTIQAIAQKGVDLVEDVTSGVTSGLTSLVKHTRDGALAVIGTQSPQSSPGGQEEFRRGVSGSLAARAAHNRERRHKTPASSLQASPASSPSSQRTV